MGCTQNGTYEASRAGLSAFPAWGATECHSAPWLTQTEPARPATASALPRAPDGVGNRGLFCVPGTTMVLPMSGSTSQAYQMSWRQSAGDGRLGSFTIAKYG